MRARVEMNAAEWRRLDRGQRRLADRFLALYGVTWSDLRDAAGNVVTHRSSPLDVGSAQAVVTYLHRGFGLGPWTRNAHVYPSLAAVAIRDARVVFGAGSPMLSAHDAETRGTPVAVIDAGGRVTPWEGVAFGHTDAELLAAPLLARAQHADAVGGGR